MENEEKKEKGANLWPVLAQRGHKGKKEKMNIGACAGQQEQCDDEKETETVGEVMNRYV